MSGSLLALLDGRPVSREGVRDADPRLRDPVPLGIYETILVLGNRPLLVRAHAIRHAAASAELGLDALDPDGLCEALVDAACAARGRRARLRLLRWRDGSRARSLITLDPEPASPAAVTMGIARERRPANAYERRHKRLDAPDLDRARREAAAAGLFDVLVLDEEGHVLEGAKTNVFWRTGRTFRTPAATLSLLPGIRREWFRRVLRRAGYSVVEVRADISQLLDADEVVATNAIIRRVRNVRILVEGGLRPPARENDGLMSRGGTIDDLG